MLQPEHYEKDEKQRTVTLTDEGAQEIEKLLGEAGILKDGGLYDIQNITLVHHANQALRAHRLLSRDNDHIVQADTVVINAELTGRSMEGTPSSDRLQKAHEHKVGAAGTN